MVLKVRYISAGWAHNAVITQDDKLFLWGKNDCGQLGNGTQSSLIEPTVINGKPTWKHVACGEKHTLGVHTDGTLWAWGDNTFGQIGNGSTQSQRTPVRITLEDNWAQVFCGDSFSMALKNDGSLWVWGRNIDGELGTGDFAIKLSPVQLGAIGIWNTVACGSAHTLGLLKDGSLWAWGKNSYGQLGEGSNATRSKPIKIGDAWERIAAGRNFSLGIKQDAALFVWGRNDFGQLGDASKVDSLLPKCVAGHWKVASCGDAFVLAIQKNGSLWAWGKNWHGQLGTGSNIDQLSPVLVSNQSNWDNVTCGYAHAFIKDSSQEYFSSGWNIYGQLGANNQSSKYVFEHVFHDRSIFVRDEFENQDLEINLGEGKEEVVSLAPSIEVVFPSSLPHDKPVVQEENVIPIYVEKDTTFVQEPIATTTITSLEETRESFPLVENSQLEPFVIEEEPSSKIEVQLLENPISSISSVSEVELEVVAFDFISQNHPKDIVSSEEFSIPVKEQEPQADAGVWASYLKAQRTNRRLIILVGVLATTTIVLLYWVLFYQGKSFLPIQKATFVKMPNVSEKSILTTTATLAEIPLQATIDTPVVVSKTTKSLSETTKNTISTKESKMTPEQEYEMGDTFYYGQDGTTKDYEKAAFWYTKSAERGNHDAQYNLGLIYSKGKGTIAKDKDKARKWLQKSADAGNSYARKLLQQI